MPLFGTTQIFDEGVLLERSNVIVHVVALYFMFSHVITLLTLAQLSEMTYTKS